jgi:hypothetical protein
LLNNVEVSDMTIDCNMEGQPTGSNTYAKVACGAVVFGGTNLYFRRLRIINFGTQTLNRECFALATGGGAPDNITRNIVIDGCVIEQPAWNNVRETTCTNHGYGENAVGRIGYNLNSITRRCYFNLDFARSGSKPSARITAASCSGLTVTITTAIPHGRAVDDWVIIAGVQVSGSTSNLYNGSWKITSVSGQTFTYSVPINPGTATVDDQSWVDRVASFGSRVTGITQVGTLVAVETEFPLDRIPGGIVVVSGVSADDPASAELYNRPHVVNSIGWDSNAGKQTIVFDLGSPPANPPILTVNSAIGQGFHAISGGGYCTVFEQNRMVNCPTGGPYHDTYSDKDVKVIDNYYRNVRTGIFFALGGVSTDSLGNLRALSSLTSYMDGASYYARASVANDFQVGDAVDIRSDNNNFDGYFTITAATSSTFDYLLSGNPGSNPTTASYGRLWQIQQLAAFDNIIDEIYQPSSAFAPYGIAALNNNSDLPAGSAGPFIFQLFVVIGNIIRPGAAQTGYSFGVPNHSSKSSIIQGNIIDANPLNQAIFSDRNSHVKTFGNETSLGARVRSYNQFAPLYNLEQYTQELEDYFDLFMLGY